MAKPVINKIQTFDATVGTTVAFSFSGNQTYENRLVISDADSSALVFDETITSFQLYHDIPANILTNHKQYVAHIQCYDKDGNASALSNGMFFQCVETPRFVFKGIRNKQTVKSSSILLEIDYYQTHGEELKDYQFYLYDGNKIDVLKSNVYYGDELSHRFIGLEDGKTYYVRAIGNTVHGLYVDTGYIEILVSYKEPSITNKIQLVNDRCRGYISYSTNIIVINCTTPKDYTYDNGFVNVLDKDITYESGYVLDGDFDLKLVWKNLNRSGKIMTMSNDKGQTVTLSALKFDSDNNVRFHLMAENGMISYNRYSKNMIVKPDDVIELRIIRRSNYYKLLVYNLYDSNMINFSGRAWVANRILYMITKDGRPYVKDRVLYVAKDDFI